MFPMENEIFVLSVSLRILLVSIFFYEAMFNLCSLMYYRATPMKCFTFFRDITYLWYSCMVCGIRRVYVEVQHSVNQIVNICSSAQNFYPDSMANIFVNICMFDWYMLNDFLVHDEARNIECFFHHNFEMKQRHFELIDIAYFLKIEWRTSKPLTKSPVMNYIFAAKVNKRSDKWINLSTNCSNRNPKQVSDFLCHWQRAGSSVIFFQHTFLSTKCRRNEGTRKRNIAQVFRCARIASKVVYNLFPSRFDQIVLVFGK